MGGGSLQRMGRAELLELLLESRRECEALKAELADRRARSSRAGSIAREALELNGVFEAAQRAAEQYVEGVGALAGRAAQARGAQAYPQAQAGPYAQPAQAGAHRQGQARGAQAYPQGSQAQAYPQAQPAQAYPQARAQAQAAYPQAHAQARQAYAQPAQSEDPYEAAAMRLAGGGGAR